MAKALEAALQAQYGPNRGDQQRSPFTANAVLPPADLPLQ